jgi:hypothetical protein
MATEYELTEDDQQHIGKWAVCSRGFLGKIEGRKELPWGLSWVGKKLDGTPWASREPIFLNKDTNYLLDETIEFRFMYLDLCK